jgi:hypothetical protein
MSYSNEPERKNRSAEQCIPSNTESMFTYNDQTFKVFQTEINRLQAEFNHVPIQI